HWPVYGFGRGAEILDRLLVRRKFAVREIQPRHIHAGAHHLFEHRRGTRGRSDGGHDLGFTERQHDRLVLGVEVCVVRPPNPSREVHCLSSRSHSRMASSKARAVRTRVLRSSVPAVYWVCRNVNSTAITFSPASSSATALLALGRPNCRANDPA